MPAFDPDPKNFTIGTSLMNVAITLPSLTGTGSLMGTLILAGTDRSTNAAPTTGNYDRIIGVMIKSHTGSYHYGTISTSTGTMDVTVLSGSNVTEPCINWHRLTYVKSSVASTMSVIAVCILK
jgi:hypothetical protein